MDYWLCVSVCLCVSVLSRERHNVQMLRVSLSESLVGDEVKGQHVKKSQKLCCAFESKYSKSFRKVLLMHFSTFCQTIVLSIWVAFIDSLNNPLFSSKKRSVRL